MSGLEWFFLAFFLVFLPLLILLGEDTTPSETIIPAFGVVGELTYLWNTYENKFYTLLVGSLVYVLWAILALVILYLFFYTLDFFLLKQEKQGGKIRTEKRLKEEEQRIKEIEILEKTMYLEEIKKKNKQLEEDIIFLKPIVSGLSIYDDDFLEQQPKALGFINEVIAQGRV